VIFFWRVILILSFALLGFAAGAFIGGRFFLAEGQGLAAGPIVLGYGLTGGLVLAVGALFAAVKSSPLRVRQFALFGLLAVTLVYAGLIWRTFSMVANQ
jgi:hypothetical protein